MPIRKGYKYTDRGGKQLRYHRVVWEETHGPIPDGYVIHHIDHNKLNNDLSNLQIMTVYAHLQHHARLNNKQLRTQTITCEWCHKTETFTSTYNKRMIYCSPECCQAAWRAVNKPGKNQPLRATSCGRCTTQFETYDPTQKYCAERCKRNAAKKRQRKKKRPTQPE